MCEITTINVINPLNPSQEKTLFKLKNKKQGPVLQTNTQQLKKEIFQETVANLGSSDESDEKKELKNTSSIVLDISDHKDRTVRTQISHIGAAFQKSELVRQTEESVAGLS